MPAIKPKETHLRRKTSCCYKPGLC